MGRAPGERPGQRPVSDPSQRRVPLDAEQVKAALGAFFNVAKRWDLSEQEQLALLGEVGQTTLHAWKQGAPPLSPDTLERISYLIGIHPALRRLFPGSPEEMSRRVRHPLGIPLTQGSSLLGFVLNGGTGAMHNTRMYLEAETGGSEAALVPKRL